MKKINMNRLAAGLLVLVLLTSCFVGSTMARYATGATGSDTARAAEFGVDIEAYGKVFGEKYVNKAGGNIQGAVNLTVSSNKDGHTNVVAPGTQGDNVLNFKISGSAEVAVKINLTLANGGLSMITLPAKQGYKDYTSYQMGTSSSNKGSYGTFNQNNAYNPIVWTLMQKRTDDDAFKQVAQGNLQAIETYLHGLAFETKGDAKIFAAGDDLAATFGEFQLSWKWAYGEDSPADTYIGKVAAGVKDEAVILNESFGFKIYIEQVD